MASSDGTAVPPVIGTAVLDVAAPPALDGDDPVWSSVLPQAPSAIAATSATSAALAHDVVRVPMPASVPATSRPATGDARDRPPVLPDRSSRAPRRTVPGSGQPGSGTLPA